MKKLVVVLLLFAAACSRAIQTTSGGALVVPRYVVPSVAPRAVSPELSAKRGQVVFHLTVPRLGLWNYPVRFGVGHAQLALGPGVYPGSAAPGRGHVWVAGHDVTPVGPWNHGPFRFLERLRPGDTATIVFQGERLHYRLVRLVKVIPTDTSPLVAAEVDLSLTSCYPPGSAQYRLVAQWEEEEI